MYYLGVTCGTQVNQPLMLIEAVTDDSAWWVLANEGGVDLTAKCPNCGGSRHLIFGPLVDQNQYPVLDLETALLTLLNNAMECNSFNISILKAKEEL